MQTQAPKGAIQSVTSIRVANQPEFAISIIQVLSTFDIRHMRIFLALHAAKNVSRAAQQVGLSQSSVSIALGQLRERYSDPLFVRTSGGMQATPRAEQLVPVIRQALHLLSDFLVSVAMDPMDLADLRSYCFLSKARRIIYSYHQFATMPPMKRSIKLSDPESVFLS